MSERETMEDISNYQGRTVVYHPDSSFPHLEEAIRTWLYCELSGRQSCYSPYDPPKNYFVNHTTPMLVPEGIDADYENDITSQPGLTLVYITGLRMERQYFQSIVRLVNNDEQTVTFNIPHAVKRTSDTDRSNRWWRYHHDRPEIWLDGLRSYLHVEGECAVAESDSFLGERSQFKAGEFSRLYRTVVRAVVQCTDSCSDESDGS